MDTTTECRSPVAGAPEDRRQAGVPEGQIRAEGDRCDGGQAARLQLREEQLHIHKHLMVAGEVRVRKEVRTEHRTIEVPVSREEIVIERLAPAEAPVTAADFAPGEVIRIPLREEQVVVEKRPVVREEVRVGKRVVQETERVDGEVRKEEVRIERIECEANGSVPAAVRGAEEAQPRGARALSEDGLETPAQSDGEAQILRRAYFKWIDESRPDGQDRRHYFEAAREVQA